MARKLRSLIIARNGDNLNPLLSALERAGFDPWWDWERCDLEPTVVDCLARGPWQILIYQWGCGVPIDRVRSIVEAHAPTLPIVIATTPDALVADVIRALGPGR